MDRRDRDRGDCHRRAGARARAVDRPPDAASWSSKAAAGPHVLVAQVGRTPATRDLKLPATIRGFDETEIYAKVPGYLKIASRSTRATASTRVNCSRSSSRRKPISRSPTRSATYNSRKITDDRNQVLVRAGVISQQTADESHAAMLQAKATLAQSVALQSYETLTAPFDGIVTARYVDPGHLIPEATSSTSRGRTRSCAIARTKPLRVYTYVPQNIALFIRNGDRATITVNEFPRAQVHRHHHAPSGCALAGFAHDAGGSRSAQHRRGAVSGNVRQRGIRRGNSSRRAAGPRRRAGVPRRQGFRADREEQRAPSGRSDSSATTTASRRSRDRHRPRRDRGVQCRAIGARGRTVQPVHEAAN